MTSRYSSVAHDSSEYSSSLHKRLSMRLSPDKKRYTLSDILRWLVKTVPPRASGKFMDTLSGSPKFVAPAGARPRRTMLVPWAIRAHICDRPRSWFGQRSAVFLSRTARFNVWSEQTLKSYPCHCTDSSQLFSKSAAPVVRLKESTSHFKIYGKTHTPPPFLQKKLQNVHISKVHSYTHIITVEL